jgi:dTDP-L-rhamnose 4-epimerase
VETNICGTANLLDILVNERHKVRKLIIAASMSSYGEGLYNCSKCGKVKPNLRNLDTKQVPLHKLRDRLFWEPDCPYCGCKVAPLPTSEDTPLVANSIYAITKKEQEEMALLIGKTYGIPVVSFRFFNVYGPRQSLSNPYTGVAAIFLSRIKNGQPPVIYEDGNQTRDFVLVGEVAQVVSRVAGTDAADFGIFNLGSGEPITILSIAEILTTIAGKDIKPNVTFRFRKGDVRHCFADISKIKKTLGFVPGISIMEGLKNLVNWSAGVHSEDRFEQAASQLIKKGLV